MGELAYRLRLFGHFARLRFKERMEYRGAFLFGIIAQVVAYGANYTNMWLILNRFQSIAGWKVEEVVFLYSLELFTYACAGVLFFEQMWQLEDTLIDGSFDVILTHPLDPLHHLIARKFNFGYIAHLSLSGSMLVWSLSNLSVNWTAGNVAWLLLFMAGAVAVQASMLVTAGAISFLMLRARIFNVMWDIKGFVSYPITIYAPALQLFLTLIVPYAFVNYFPATALLGKDPGTLFPAPVRYLTPLVGGLLLWGAIRLWYRGLRRYEGAGS